MRLPGTSNELSQPTYDTVQVAVAAVAQTVSFFLTPLGGVMAGAVLKTRSDTNLVQAGRLDKGKTLEIQAISMHVRQTATGGAAISRADYDTIYNRSFVDLFIGGNTSFLRVPAIQIPAGNAQIEYRSNITAAVTEFSMWHGASLANNLFHLPISLNLEDQESIQVDLTIEAAIVAVCDVGLTLWGIEHRPVR